MARDPRDCLIDIYWEEIEYEPVGNKKLLVWPDPICIGSTPAHLDPSCSKNREAGIKFFKELLDMGFSLLYTRGDYCADEWAAAAGWKKNQIVIDLADGRNLGDMRTFEDHWNNLWREQHKHLSPLPDPPSFHAIFYDEPWKKGEIVNSDFSELEFPSLISREDVEKLCNGDLDHLFTSTPEYRFYLTSLYIHECLRTRFIVGAYNSIWTNYWSEINKLNNNPYNVHGTAWNKWVDCIMSTRWQWWEWFEWYDQFDEQKEINEAGIGCDKVFMRLEHHSQYEVMFNRMAYHLPNTNEIWFYPGEDEDKDDWSCQDYLIHLRRFVNTAFTKGWLQVKSRRIFHRVEQVPGCLGWDPFRF